MPVGSGSDRTRLFHTGLGAAPALVWKLEQRSSRPRDVQHSRDENESIVDAFLSRHAGFALIDASAELARAGSGIATGRTMTLLPRRHGRDEFLAAVEHWS